MLLWIAAEVFEGDGGFCDGVAPGTQILFYEFIQRGQIGETGGAPDAETILHPGFFVAALGVGFADTQTLGDLGADLVVGFAFAGRVDQFGLQDDFVAVFPAVLHAPGFELGAGGQDDVGKAGGGGQEVVLDDEKFDFGLVAQDFGGAVDVGVLVDQAVGGDGVDQLDVALEAGGAGDSVGLVPISFPRRQASVHRKTGMAALTGFSPVGKTVHKPPPSGACNPNPLAQPPEIPKLPVMAASVHPARTTCSP